MINALKIIISGMQCTGITCHVIDYEDMPL
jgi:hypothetical protein